MARLKGFLIKGLPHQEWLEKIYNDGKFREHTEEVIEKMDCLITDPKKAIEGDIPKKFPALKELKKVISQLDEKQKNFLRYVALYHDIGKAINPPRHGFEGAELIKDSDFEERKRFRKIKIEKDELFLMSELVRYHDFFGTLGTGESSYLHFVKVLCPVTNLALTKNDCFLNSLLLINLADIAASARLDAEKLNDVIYDFKVIKKVHEEVPLKIRRPALIISGLEAEAVNNTFERVRRLVRTAFNANASNPDVELFIKEEYPFLIKHRRPFKDWFVLEDTAPIMASLRGLNIEKYFCEKLAFICNFDYLISFLKRVVNTMLSDDYLKRNYGLKSKTGKFLKDEESSIAHDLRRDIAMSIVEFSGIIVDNYGYFTDDHTRIGIECGNLRLLRDKTLKRLVGLGGGFKHTEATSKIKTEVLMWVIRP